MKISITSCASLIYLYFLQSLWQSFGKCSETFLWPSKNFWRIFRRKSSKLVFGNPARKTVENVVIQQNLYIKQNRFSRSQKLKIVQRGNCWDCDSFFVGKATKRQLHGRNTEHLKLLTDCHFSAVAGLLRLVSSIYTKCLV